MTALPPPRGPRVWQHVARLETDIPPAGGRSVLPFTSYDDAHRDVLLRGHCVLFDLHGLWWSVPAEYTVHDVNRLMHAELDALGVPPLPNQVHKQAVRQRFVR